MRNILRRIAARAARSLDLPIIVLPDTEAPDSSKWHQDLIVHIASLVRPHTYVELGVHRCSLFNRMVPLARRLIAVDADPAAGGHMVKSPKARFVAGTTESFVRSLEREPIEIDLLFIDADHSKEAVDADFTGCLPFVRDHGLILLHDTHPEDDEATRPERCGDGYLAIERLCRRSERYEMMTLPRHPGLTLCRKRTRQLAWQETGLPAPPSPTT